MKKKKKGKKKKKNNYSPSKIEKAGLVNKEQETGKPSKTREANYEETVQKVEILTKDQVEYKKNKEVPKKSFVSRHRNTIFFFLLSYLLIRIFITDIDLLLITKYTPVTSAEYIIGRFFILVISFFVIWKAVGNTRFWKKIGQFFIFLAYPGVWSIVKTTVWKVPKYLIKKKQNYLLYLYVETVISFLVKFKSTVLKFCIFFLGFYITFFSNNPIILWIGIMLLLVSQILHLIKRWNELFGPIKIFQLKLSPINEEGPFSITNFEEQILENTKKAKHKNKEPVVLEMEQYLLMHEVLKAFDKKVKDILTSQTYMKGFVLKSLYSFLFAMLIFGGVNFCLYKINNGNFLVTGAPEYFEFFYYSYFNIISEGVDVEPTTRISKAARMIGVSVGVVINFLILAVYFTVNSDRYKKNLEHMSLWTTKVSDEVTSKFQSRYNQNPEEGQSFLLSKGSEFVKHLAQLKKFFKK